MTRKEFKEAFRKTKGFNQALDKIRGYPQGFEFTIHFPIIPKAKDNAIRMVLQDACKLELLEIVSFRLDLQGNTVEEIYKRL